jgi:predicted Zn-dependent protease
MWTEKQARTLTDRVLSFSRAPECEVTLSQFRSSYTRFAANEVTTSGAVDDLRIHINSRGGGRSGSVTLNDPDAASLEAAVARSEELMAVSPVDPEFIEGLDRQKYRAIKAYHPDTARAGAVDRRTGVKAALDLARSTGLAASGLFETEAATSVIANKKGNFAWHQATRAGYSATMRTADGTGSGWAGGDAPRLGDLAPAALAARAARKAESSARPRALPPGLYTVILEPQAVSDLLGNLSSALNARSADEGRSFFARPGGGNRIGERLFAESVTVRTDPFDPRVPGTPWADDRLPARSVTWIEKGVLKALALGRYWARKTEREPVPLTGSLILDGGTGTVDDLVAGADRALLVTRFWYIRTVNPRTIQLTGLTRDGVWLVEKGKVVGPVNNFRFNESPANLLANVEALSAAVVTRNAVVPAIRARNFNFSSKSDAV